MDYGQNIVLSTGNFLCSAPSVNSTMDFSKKRVEDGVVDSPIEKKVKVTVGNSTLSLYTKEQKVATMSVSDVVRLMRRKVYKYLSLVEFFFSLYAFLNVSIIE